MLRSRLGRSLRDVAGPDPRGSPASTDTIPMMRAPEAKKTPATLGLRSEEDVKIHFLLAYLEARGYQKNCIDFNVAVEVTEGRKKKTIFADAVVRASAKSQAPVLLCETKAPNEILDRQVREQAISYARLLPRIAPLVLITNGSQVQVFHTLNKNRVPELPKREELDRDILRFVVDPGVQEALRQEAKHDLFIIDDVRTFKNILKACHNEIRNNEGLDPTAAFDEMSKVMFCKLYEEKENAQGNRFRLAVFDDSMSRLHVNVVHAIMDEAKAAPAYAGIFAADTAINLKDRTIRKIVEHFENYDLGLTAFDVKGEAFEYFLGDTFTGGLGEFFTPRNVVEFIADAADPKIGDRIIDPFCGTGGFLIYAFEMVGEKIRLQEFSEAEKKRWRLELSSRSLYGTDWKERTSQACKMNMTVHGDGSSGVFRHDGFVDIPGAIEEDTFDLCLTNPPFGSKETDPAILNLYELGSGRRSQDRAVLALERCLRLVRPEGRVAIVIIDGVLNNKKLRYAREFLRRNAWIEAVVSLNPETFEGYGARAKTSILFLQRKAAPDDGRQKPLFMAIASNTGLAPNGDQIPGNELPEILIDFRAFKGGTLDPAAPRAASWVCGNLQDRLDAEFYRPTAGGQAVDIGDVRMQFASAMKQTQADFESLTDLASTLDSLNTRPLRLSDILEETKVKEPIDPKTSYRLLGVRWWGFGAFIREEKPGSEIKAKSLYRVSTGWIVYNRLFAFRGSFARITEDCDGCYASSEFPTFRVKDDVADADLLASYIVHCMNSPQFLTVVDQHSTGSTKTSRNRFNQTAFLNVVIEVPTTGAELKRAVELLDTVDRLRDRFQGVMEPLTKFYREGAFRMLPGPPGDF